MDMSQPSLQTLAVPDAHAAAWQQALAQASTAAIGLPELMGEAGRWQALGLADAAAALYLAWIAASDSPLRTVACYNCGTLLGNLQRHAEAEQVYRQALALKPDFAQARLNLGHQLEHLGRVAEALAAWQAVAESVHGLDSIGGDPLELRLHAMNNLARLLELQKRFAESQSWMRRSLELKPEQSDVIQHYVHIRQKQCEWPVYQPVGEVTHNQLLCSTSLLAMLSISDDPVLQLMTSQRFVLEKVNKYKGKPYHQLHASGPRQGRLKIGYLSGDLCMHAVGLLTPELFELHDRERVEVHAFCWSREDGSAQRRRILGAMDQVHRIGGLDDEAAARLIAQQGIDVLVDLQGLTNGARPNILSLRPAPVQVSYLGLPATSALPGVDWIIADRFVMPPDYLSFCTERPIVLDHCYQISDRQREVGPVPSRAQYQLPEDAFVFCSFNNNHKFNEEMFAAWMRILRQVPGSVLWLLADNEWAKANMLATAAAHGVAAERLIFAPRVAPPEYLARFALADLVLDTFPFNAGTTASDCLWMGAPILTRSGRSYISRMAGSLLTHVGLPDLVTYSLQEYEQRAVQIGQNPARSASYKRYLSEHGRASTLFDIPGMVRELEDKFEALALPRRQPEGTR
ncbi:O-linked N-acetylglucosamine transferase, SPINDLY family protein [Paucibacter sp. M5-1]|uniref:O-linked N-acetylglucosamine transferase, SPINDLY family protein n=1 Tax=Paucibacter sp. M5-1 TaxID=3015998 RepID=UPI0022B8BDCB|nr:tetratricopeptide repeat protein [Paucibacter sp. M5-1]MCZ7884810.1 acetylglucosamine transferase [Paucibacter sp. M5-1]